MVIKSKIFLGVFFALFLFVSPLKASHLLGGEITWECIPAGPDAGKMVFQIKLYKACYQGAASLSNTASIANPLYALYGGSSTITCVLLNKQDLSQPCFSPNYQGMCNRPLALGGGAAVEEWVYFSSPVQINGVPDSAGSEFYWTSCCRPTLLNILGSSYYLRSVMYPYTDPVSNQPRSIGSTLTGPSCYDSSPQFAARPSVSLCSKQNVFYDHMMVDANGDSIRYDWSNPMQTATNPITWKLNYSTTLPLPNYAHDTLNIGPFLDTVTGIVQYYGNTPANGYHSICIKGTSFKNGQKVAEVYRDIVVTVIDCDTITSFPKVSNHTEPSIGIKESSASVYAPYFQGVYPVGSTISLDISVEDLDSLPTNPISDQSVDLEIYGVSMSSDPNNSINCAVAPCAYLDSNNTAWNGYQFIDTTRLTARFTWNTSCLNLEEYSSYTGGTNYRNFIFQVRSKDNWCPNPKQKLTYISIGLVDTSSTTWPLDTVDASNGGAVVSWPQYSGSNFISYEIYRSYDLQSPWSLVANISNVNTTSYHDQTAGTDTASVFYLVEINNGPGCYIGYEVKSMHLTTTEVNKQSQLHWNRPYVNTVLYNSGKYYIYRMDTLNTWNLIDSTLFGVEQYLDQNVVYNSRMDYKIESRDYYGLTSVSNVDTLQIDSVFIVTPGMKELDSKLTRVYPNPFKDEVVIDLPNDGENYDLDIYNLEGKIAFSGSLRSKKTALNTSEFPAGVYYLHLMDSRGNKDVLKLIKTEQ